MHGFFLRLLFCTFALGLLAAPSALTAPGDLDSTFGTSGIVLTDFGSINGDSARGVALQSDQKIVVAGSSGPASSSDFAVARYTASGALDSTFGTDGRVITSLGNSTDAAYCVALQSDHKIVVAGVSYNGGIPHLALVRYTVSGGLDTTFGAGGKVIEGFGGYGWGYSVAVQNDGKIVVAGDFADGNLNSFGLVRYTDLGALDPSFGNGGKVPLDPAVFVGYGVAVQTDGKIVVAGYSYSGSKVNFGLARYTPSGALDPSFGTSGKVTTPISDNHDSCQSVAVQSDGKIVVAGSSNPGNNADFALVRYTDGGALDTSFDTDGIVTTPIGSGHDIGQSVAVQSNGKIVVAGSSYNGTYYDFALVRYTTAGALDASFGAGGKVTTPIGVSAVGYSVALQNDGKIFVAGNGFGTGGVDFALVRYEGDATDDDVDHDGLTALEELAFGLNPTVPDSHLAPRPGAEGGYLTITLTKHPGAAYEVQSAGTLLSGQPASFSPATTTVLLDTATTLKVRDNVPIGTPPARFLRVKVIAAP